MKNCLVTKLKGIIQNSEELLRLGECVISIESTEENETLINTRLLGTYYSDKAHLLGTEDVLPNERKEVSEWEYIKSKGAGIYTFHFLDKYSIDGLLVQIPAKAVVGLTYLRDITQLQIISEQNYDIANLKNMSKLGMLTVAGNVYGDIAYLKDMKLTSFKCNDSQVSGDIANLKDMKLTSFKCNNSQLSGDIANLKDMKLSGILQISKTNISGDIAMVPNDITWLACSTKQSFTWTTSNRTNILAIENAKCDNIDKLLNDMSTMNAKFGGDAEYYKTISLHGNRTAASDAAVQTLQSKGYTVSITPA